MITVITGHYGSGKSTIAAHLSAKAAENKSRSVCIVDMDTVNPYFRTADLEEYLNTHGVTLIAPMYARTNLDVPVLNYDIEAICGQYDDVFIDMGGDYAGAYPLGRYRRFLSARDDVEVLYTVNFRRFLTQTAEEAAEVMNEIVTACGLKITGIVNNTNLGKLTDADIISDGVSKANMLSELTGVPVFFSTAPGFTDIDGFMPIEILMKSADD